MSKTLLVPDAIRGLGGAALINLRPPIVSSNSFMIPSHLRKLCFVALAAFASDKNKDAKKEMSKDATVSGWVTDPACGKNGKVEMLNNAECTKRCAKDGKYVLVTDGDSKVWAVTNSEVLKGHEGHHVQLSAHVYADKGQIHVMSVKMLKKATSAM